MSQKLSFIDVIRQAPKKIIICDDDSSDLKSFSPNYMDEQYHHRPYAGDKFIEGRGTKNYPYSYISAAPISPHYCIIDLWFHLRHRGNVMIEVNDELFELQSTGVKSSHGCFTRLLPE